MEAGSSRSNVGRPGLFWGLLPWLTDGLLLTVSSQDIFSVRVHSWCLSLFLEGHHSYWIRANIMTSFNLNYFFKGLTSKQSHSKVLKARTSTYEFRENNSAHNKNFTCGRPWYTDYILDFCLGSKWVGFYSITDLWTVCICIHTLLYVC